MINNPRNINHDIYDTYSAFLLNGQWYWSKFEPTRTLVVTTNNLRSFRKHIPAYHQQSLRDLSHFVNDIIIRLEDLSKESQIYINNIYDEEFDLKGFEWATYWRWRLMMLKEYGFTHFPNRKYKSSMDNYILSKYKRMIKPCLL